MSTFLEKYNELIKEVSEDGWCANYPDDSDAIPKDRLDNFLLKIYYLIKEKFPQFSDPHPSAGSLGGLYLRYTFGDMFVSIEFEKNNDTIYLTWRLNGKYDTFNIKTFEELIDKMDIYEKYIKLQIFS